MIFWFVEGAIFGKPCDVVFGDVFHGFAFVFAEGHDGDGPLWCVAFWGGGVGVEEFDDGGQGEVVGHSVEDLLEDEDIVEGAVGVIGFDAVDFAQVLEAMAWQVGAVASGPFEGVEGFPAGGHGEVCAGEFGAHEGHVEAFAVVGDEDGVILAEGGEGFGDGGKVIGIGDHGIGDAADACGVGGDGASWVDKLAECLSCGGVEGGKLDDAVFCGGQSCSFCIEEDGAHGATAFVVWGG